MIPIDSALHGDVIIYQSGQENISTNGLFKDETFWMTQKDMATLFGVSLSSVSRHLKNIFESNELDESVVIAEIAITTKHGALAQKTQSSTVKLYNLDAIIAVGKYFLILTESYTSKTSNRVNQKRENPVNTYVYGVYYSLELFSCDCCYWANGFARTAINASFIDFVFNFAFSNCSYWTNRSTRTTFNACITNNAHETPP